MDKPSKQSVIFQKEAEQKETALHTGGYVRPLETEIHKLSEAAPEQNSMAVNTL